MPDSFSRPSTRRPPVSAVYRAHHGFVWQVLRGLGVSARDLEDAVQDVFVVVLRRYADFEHRAAVRTWLYEIARRVAWHYRERARRASGRREELREVQAPDDVEALMGRAQAMAMLNTFLAGLDEPRRRVFMLAEFGQLRGPEIAETLDVNLNTIYARLRSARQELDRYVRRQRASNARELLAEATRARPSAAVRRRTYVALVARFGFASVSASVVAAGVLAAVLPLGWWFVRPTAQQPTVEVARAPEPARVPAPAASSLAATTQAAVLVPDAVPRPSASGPRRVKLRKRRDEAKPTSGLAEELALVHALREALGDERGFGRLSALYDAQYGGGPLAVEVEALRLEQACRLHRASGRAVDAFAERHPRSALTLRLRSQCEASITPQKPRGDRTQ